MAKGGRKRKGAGSDENQRKGEWVTSEMFIPEGSHLSKSRTTPGLDRALLRDKNNKVLGPPETRAVREPSATRSPEHEAARGAGAIEYRSEATSLPKQAISELYKNEAFREWATQQALPWMWGKAGEGWRAVVEKYRARRDRSRLPAEPKPELNQGTPDPELEVVDDDLTPHMSQDEYDERVRRLALAQELLQQEEEFLRKAAITDEEPALELSETTPKALGTGEHPENIDVQDLDDSHHEPQPAEDDVVKLD